MTVAVLTPMLGGALIPVIPFRNRRQMLIYIETLVLLNSLLVISLLLNRPDGHVILFRIRAVASGDSVLLRIYEA